MAEKIVNKFYSQPADAVIPVAYCPRCEKVFMNMAGEKASRADMEAHLKEAHKDYYETTPPA